MSKEKETNEVPVTPTLDATALLALIMKMQQDNANTQAEQTKLLAQALADSRKPYVDPKQEENRLAGADQLRNIEHGKLRRAKMLQNSCEHEQGMTGDERNGKGSFACLKLPTGETIGVCFYCQKVISSVNPKHGKYFRKKSGRVAEAGQFMLMDPVESALARLSVEERDRVKKFRQEIPVQVPQEVEED